MTMYEAVVVRVDASHNSDGDPVAGGEPVELRALVSPGNTLQRPGMGGDLDKADFTVFLMPRRRALVEGQWVSQRVADLLGPPDGDFSITVRGRVCRGRVQDWGGPAAAQGGIAVLATSAKGRS